MAKPKPDTIQSPPFPELTWDDFFWTCETNLPSWRGFRSCRGPYGSNDSVNASDGTVAIVIGTDDETRAAPQPEQAAAYQYLCSQHEAVASAILNRLFNEYPKLQEEYSDFVEAHEMPPIKTPNDLKNLFGLANVHIHQTAKDGVSYVGLEFGCTWDMEHGIGAMMHKDRIVDFGGADTAILEWIADRDAKR